MSTIRRAQPGDLAAIVPLMVAFNEVEGIVWQPEVMREAVVTLLGDESIGVVLVAEDEQGATAGYSIATFGYDIEFAGRDAFVTELFVAPDARRHGVGRALLQRMIRELGDRGAGAIHLVVRPENGAAKRVYGRLGFREVPRQLMTLKLDQPS